MEKFFIKVATKTSHIIGSPWAFITALIILVAWAISGPFLHFSDTWQLVINTGTTIVTFLIVFLIQNTQNRDAKAMQLKLDAIIYALAHVSNRYIDIEELDDKKLEEMKQALEKTVRDTQLIQSHRKRSPGSKTR